MFVIVATAQCSVKRPQHLHHLIYEPEMHQNSEMKHRSGLLGTFAVLGALAATPAFAAPQILAVMSPQTPQQLRCAGEMCTTDFSSYCLQRERDIPATGHDYTPAAPEQFTLILTDANGIERRLPASDAVSFQSVRGYAMVRALVRAQTLASLGAVSARLDVAKGAALVPVPEPGDNNPISEAEMAFATRSLREHGEEIVDAKPAAQAATIVNRLATTIVPSMKVDQPSLDRLWRDVIDDLGPVRPAGSDAIERARRIYDWCQGRTSYHSMGGIKSCLEFKHDDEIMRLNSDYWNGQPSY